LPSVQSVGFGLETFVVSPQKILSYTITQNAVNTTSCGFDINIVSIDASLITLTFSVIVITQDNSYVELGTLASTTSPDRSNGLNIYGSSSKFTFGGTTDPYVMDFFSWITGGSLYYSTSSYKASMTLNKIIGTSIYYITFSTSNSLWMSGVSVNVLFVTRQIGGIDIPTYNYLASGGSTLSLTFVTDFGIPISDYGLPTTTSHCIMGIY
jgi:hypothetical protein